MSYFMGKAFYPYEYSDLMDVLKFLIASQRLPEKNYIFEQTRKCKTFNEAKKKVHEIFSSALKDALVRGISGSVNEELLNDLSIEFVPGKRQLSDDDIHVKFKNLRYINPNCDELERLRYHIKTFDKSDPRSTAYFPPTMDVFLSSKAYMKIKEIMGEFVIETKAPRPYGSVLFIVILSFVRHLSSSEAAFNKKVERMWTVLRNEKPLLGDLEQLGTEYFIFRSAKE